MNHVCYNCSGLKGFGTLTLKTELSFLPGLLALKSNVLSMSRGYLLLFYCVQGPGVSHLVLPFKPIV